MNLCGTTGGGGGWSGTSAGLGLRLGEHVELVDIGLYWPDKEPLDDQLI